MWRAFWCRWWNSHRVDLKLCNERLVLVLVVEIPEMSEDEEDGQNSIFSQSFSPLRAAAIRPQNSRHSCGPGRGST